MQGSNRRTVAGKGYRRRGLARGAIALIGAAIAIAVLALVLWYEPERGSSTVPSGPAEPSDSSAPAMSSAGGGSGAEEPGQPAQPSARRAEAASAAGRPAAPSPGAASQASGPPGAPVGVLRGTVEVPGGAELEGPLTVRLSPSLTLAGRERAETRELELPPDTREFRFDGLPLAAYDVEVASRGWFSMRQAVALLPGSPHALVVVVLRRTGWLGGRVLDTDGAFVEGLAVVLESQSPRRRHTEATRADGVFRFQDLLDGNYTLSLGPADAPFAPLLRVEYRVPSMDLGDLRVAPMGSLRVRVIDGLGRGVSGVRVRGLGSAGGLVDGVTDAVGELLVPLQRPGRYRLRAEHGDLGRGLAVADLEFAPGEIPLITIELSR